MFCSTSGESCIIFSSSFCCRDGFLRHLRPMTTIVVARDWYDSIMRTTSSGKAVISIKEVKSCDVMASRRAVHDWEVPYVIMVASSIALVDIDAVAVLPSLPPPLLLLDLLPIHFTVAEQIDHQLMTMGKKTAQGKTRNEQMVKYNNI